MIIRKINLPVVPDSPIRLLLPFYSAGVAAKAVLKVDSVKGVPQMWYQEDMYPEFEDVDSTFWIVGLRTNHMYESVFLREFYIGTASVLKGSYELHYFLLDPKYALEFALGNGFYNRFRVPESAACFVE